MVKKTILIIRNAAKSDFGGAETYSVSLASLLSKNGFSPIIITSSKKLQAHALDNKISVKKCWWLTKQNWSGWRILLTPLYAIWQIALTIRYILLIRETDADIVHIQSRDDFIAATIASKILRKTTIWTDHMDLRYIFQNLNSPFKNLVGKLVFWTGKFADKIILISDNEYRLVTAHFKHNRSPWKNIIIVKNGVIDSFDEYDNTKSSSTFTFCLASRIVANKGIAEAILAFKKLRLCHPEDRTIQECNLAIYGDGCDINKFKQLANSDPAIIFCGHQSNALSKIKLSNVYILPSYQEGFSIALLEATMLGKAIIATDVDSNSEIIQSGKTGLLIKPRDIDDLEKAMYMLISDRKLVNLLEKGARNNYVKNFNLENIVKEQIIPLYSQH